MARITGWLATGRKGEADNRAGDALTWTIVNAGSCKRHIPRTILTRWMPAVTSKFLLAVEAKQIGSSIRIRVGLSSGSRIAAGTAD
jgi:hypothetical protein